MAIHRGGHQSLRSTNKHSYTAFLLLSLGLCQVPSATLTMLPAPPSLCQCLPDVHPAAPQGTEGALHLPKENQKRSLHSLILNLDATWDLLCSKLHLFPHKMYKLLNIICVTINQPFPLYKSRGKKTYEKYEWK